MGKIQEQFYVPYVHCECCSERYIATACVEDYSLLVVSTYTDLKYLNKNDESTLVDEWKQIDNIQPQYIKSLTNEDIDGILLYTEEGIIPMVPNTDYEKVFNKHNKIIPLFEYYKK